MSKKLSDFSNGFGKIGQGFHSTRFLGLAMFDVIATIGLGIIVSFIFGLPLYFLFNLSELEFKELILYWSVILIFSIIVMFIFGIILHRLFNVKTTIDKIIFGE